MSNRSSGNDTGSRLEKLGMHLALTNQDRQATNRCPSPEQLAALIDGGLNPPERESVLAHLNVCVDCYEEWLAAASVNLEEERESRVVDLQARMRDPKSADKKAAQTPGQRKRSTTFAGIPTNWLSGFGLALAACLVLVFSSVFRTPSLGDQIAHSYRQFQSGVGSTVQDNARNRLQLPWEKSAVGYGFAGGAPAEPAVLAFAAGLWVGREQLGGEKGNPILPDFLAPTGREKAPAASWENTAVAPYFLLGRWLILLQVACDSREILPEAFWKEQENIRQAAAKTVAARVKDDTAAGASQEFLNNLQPALQILRQQSANQRARQTVATQLYNFTARMGLYRKP